MAMSKALERKLSERYTPSSMIELTFRGHALAVKTDSDGNAMLAFIGSKAKEGRIRGERYVRTLKTDHLGQVIKDHWEMKGKV